MTTNGWLQIALFALVILATTRPLGGYMYRVFEGERPPLPRVFGPLERALYRLCGVDPRREQGWKGYATALLLFSACGVLVTYALQRLQHLLPFNPERFGPVASDLALDTAASFATNTNWQNYGGESTMSYLTQMAGLAWHNFTSAAAGIGVALALARGLTRQPGPGGPKTLGSFWVDLVRSIVYLLLPVSVAVGLALVAMGVPQTLSAYREISTVEGAKQVIALGPVASQEVIKMFGTNGGGFFNANSAHPFENPTPLVNFVQLVLIFAIPAGLTYTYGKMARSTRQGWAIFGAMAILWLAGVLATYHAESHPNPALASLAVDHGPGNLEGKELRFGVANSALFATVTTDASCGAVNAMHDSFTPLGGLVPMVNMQLGEVIFGGVGAGLYGILVMVVLTVFIAGLMVGRTPEYLGKKIEGRELKLAMLYLLVFPAIVLTLTAWSSVVGLGTSSLGNAGPHGLSELLYAYSSGAANNGSAFAGLNGNTRFWNLTLAVDMLVGRFWMIIPALGIAGSMVGKKVVAPGLGTFPTTGLTFTVLLVAVVLIVGALTYFPALSLGPVLEHFAAVSGKVF
ncbi:potassium-transporting ATPase subunit KdpA [Anaeromyxobacter diazotrophicus]|uniref:Potassium-transporting ATPase potassium-binding subunit n=1 Tax=Anaeromyxobacter diazotrophicus TaxID=2590199 RepID=A0A7I9VGF6_9BACT|nr:potassium-transporting ATPase subunit KdpA [Anaeromyxobacter diazotrophicus]GEJ55473.1 potassium-transporting ATPase potassium-binding subunit [Anaeromyxobacter diazotrophicus]